MMLASWYVALGHRLPPELPRELRPARDRLLFARWLVMTGRLSDFGPYPAGPMDGGRPSWDQLAETWGAWRPDEAAVAPAARAG